MNKVVQLGVCRADDRGVSGRGVQPGPKRFNRFRDIVSVVHAKGIEDNVSDRGNGEDKVGNSQPEVLKGIIVASPGRVVEPLAPTARGARGWLVNGFTNGLAIVSTVKRNTDKVTGA